MDKTPRSRSSSYSSSRAAALSPDQLSGFRVRSDSSRDSSFPTTPAPTPQLQLSTCMHPEQLAAGIKQLKGDEGYIEECNSFPGTPAPSPFSPSPGQSAAHSQALLRPDQIAEGINRLRQEDEESQLDLLHLSSGLSSGQPPTPSSTPAALAAPQAAAAANLQQHLLLIPERLLDNATRQLTCDEGLESGSNPGTPLPTPTTGSLRSQNVPPEQLAAGIHRLKAEEGMSSGGSSGFPSTPAPTPFSHLAGGVLPEDLAAGISRLSVIEEADNINMNNNHVGQSSGGTHHASVVLDMGGSEQSIIVDGVDEMERPTSLLTNSSNMSSLYATPTAPTPGIHVLESGSRIEKTADSSSILLPSGLSLDDCTTEDELWIPSSATAAILKNMKESESYFPQKSSLTFTALYSKDEGSKDPIKALITHFHGASEASRRSHIPSADSVSQDLEGLRHLIQSECYRAALVLTGRILLSMRQVVNEDNHFIKHTPMSLQIWFIRLSLLVKLNLINKAEAESEPFSPDGDKPDLYFEFYPSDFPGRKGPMMSFSFRLLLAQIPQFHGKVHETLDRLYSLLSKVKNIQITIPQDEKNKARTSLWAQREIHVLYALINSYLIQNDYFLAVETTNTLLEREKSDKKAGVYSLLGRIYLQLGDVESGGRCFTQASEHRDASKPEDLLNNLLDASLLSIGNQDYPGALSILGQARELSPGNPIITNNCSVCLLPLGRLGEALSLLEASITNDPLHFQFEEPIRNLSTLYDLESSYVGQKRQRLLGLIAQYKGDGFNPGCIQLPSS